MNNLKKRKRRFTILCLVAFVALSGMNIWMTANKIEQGILKTVSSRFQDYKGLKLNVDVDGRDVTLSGFAASDQQIRRIEGIVSRLKAVRKVNNKLVVGATPSLKVIKADAGLLISGDLPNNSVKNYIVSMGLQLFPQKLVKDKTEITSNVIRKTYLYKMPSLMELLVQLPTNSAFHIENNEVYFSAPLTEEKNKKLLERILAQRIPTGLSFGGLISTTKYVN